MYKKAFSLAEVVFSVGCSVSETRNFRSSVAGGKISNRNLKLVQEQNSRIIRYKRAFTLSEVLIVLMVIGLLSAMTIPALITKYQKIVTVNKLKIEYGKFASLITRSVTDNGSPSSWITEFENINNASEKSNLIAEKYIIPYISGDVYPFKQYEYGTLWSLGGKEGFFAYYHTGRPYRIKNGTIFQFSITQNNTPVLLLDIDNKITNNRVGKDVFMFVINSENNRLEPMGSNFSQNVLKGIDKDRWCKPPECKKPEWLSGWEACNKDNTNRYGGAFCTALIVQNGWKIPKDYPW